jgi:acyl dehydratase
MSYLEDFKVGKKVISPGRTITETDVVMCAALSGDWNEIHTNTEYVKDKPFGKRVVHGILILSIVSGLRLRTKGFLPAEVLALLGFDKVRFLAPVFIGDTIKVELEVIEARPSKSRSNAGILKILNTVKNQKNEKVATWEITLMIGKRPR